MGELWGIVLAGGVGSRLGKEAVRRYGYARPKQFCDFDGRGTLLEQTISRTLYLVPEDRVVVVTTHPWSESEAVECLAPFPRAQHVRQPTGRDTGPGILLPLLHVLERDPDAIVAILPSDHHVARPVAFCAAVAEAVQEVRYGEAGVVLLGSPPEKFDEGLGWIVPTEPGARCCRVRRFREKPPVADAEALLGEGAVVNTFVMVARAYDLADLCAEHMPDWWRALTSPRRSALERAYEALPPVNFSRAVLEQAVPGLHLMSLGQVGWSDIGTPERLQRSLGQAIAAK